MKVRLKELGEIITGNTPSKKIKEFWNSEDIYFIKPDIIEDSGVNEISETKEYISEEARKKARIVTKKSIFVTCIGSIGKIGIASAGEYAFNQQINAIVPNEKVQSKYLAYNLLYNKPRLVAMANAPVVPIINKRQFGEFIVNIETDIGRQVKIVNVLDRLTHIIRLSKQELEKLDELIKARFVEMFGDSASNEKGWKMNTFGDICTVRQGLQIPISKRLTEYEEDSYEYITVQYLHGGKEKEYIKSPKESVKCTKDDILMTRTGNTGMVVTNVEGVFHNNFFLIDFDRERFEKDFLVEYLNLDLIQADITRRAGTSTIPDLNHGEFYKIKVFEPPIDLQKEFDEFKMHVDKSKVAVQKALDETQTLFDSLMQEYFG